MRLLPKKPVEVRGKVIGGHQPLICLPLVGKTGDAILTDLKRQLSHQPDLIEWRADFYNDLEDVEKTVALGKKIRAIAGDLPVIFTVRWEGEGGQPIALSEKEKVDLITCMCEKRVIDIVDYELACSETNATFLRQVTETNEIKFILSHHNFQQTPPLPELLETMLELERKGADIVKMAVMPKTWDDVLHVMQASLVARRLLQVPMIAIAMGQYGVVSRLAGWVFGSDVTFAFGNEQSAPGQVPIADLRTVIDRIEKNMG